MKEFTVKSDLRGAVSAPLRMADMAPGKVIYSHSQTPEPDRSLLPSSNDERKKIPLSSGVLDYFSSALIEVAKVSHFGNEQHNPGEPLHWARGKSMNQEDALLHHYFERGTFDSDGQRHSAKMAWRALALLQLELEAAGAPMARGAR